MTREAAIKKIFKEKKSKVLKIENTDRDTVKVYIECVLEVSNDDIDSFIKQYKL